MKAMIEVGAVVETFQDHAWGLIETAMRSASPADISAAAFAVRLAGVLRRKCGMSSAAHDEIEREYLAYLSERLTLIDDGTDHAGVLTAAILIKGGPVTGVDGQPLDGINGDEEN